MFSPCEPGPPDWAVAAVAMMTTGGLPFFFFFDLDFVVAVAVTVADAAAAAAAAVDDAAAGAEDATAVGGATPGVFMATMGGRA